MIEKIKFLCVIIDLSYQNRNIKKKVKERDSFVKLFKQTSFFVLLINKTF